MKFAQKFTLLVMILTVCGVSAVFAQAKQRPSQKGSIEQTVATTQIKITYSRPNAKDRLLWGEKTEKALVPYGEVWRAGANEATVFEVSTDVMINGKPLPAGKYSFYAIPTADSWTLIFNKTWEQWGTIYDEKMDALRVMSKPMMSEESKESLAYLIEDVDANSATIVLAWGKARIPFKVTVG